MNDPIGARGGVAGRPAQQAPEARHLRISTTPAGQLSTALAWLALVSKRRVSDDLVRSIMEHQRRTRCEPAILEAAVIQYLVMNADREKDFLNRYWHIVDQISARTRARYLNIEEKDLQ